MPYASNGFGAGLTDKTMMIWGGTVLFWILGFFVGYSIIIGLALLIPLIMLMMPIVMTTGSPIFALMLTTVPVGAGILWLGHNAREQENEKMLALTGCLGISFVGALASMVAAGGALGMNF